MKKIIAVVLSLCVILGCVGFTYAAEDVVLEKDYEVSDKIRNVSITMGSDPTTQRGVCWHTDEESATAVQFVIADKYEGFVAFVRQHGAHGCGKGARQIGGGDRVGTVGIFAFTQVALGLLVLRTAAGKQHGADQQQGKQDKR